MIDYLSDPHKVYYSHYARTADRDVVEFAIATFSFLVRGRKLTLREFASEIKKHYDIKGDERIGMACIILERYSMDDVKTEIFNN